MNFNIPRLRVNLATIYHRYAEFLKRPSPFISRLIPDLPEGELLIDANKLLDSGDNAEQAPLERFVEELSIYLSLNSTVAINSRAEAILTTKVDTLPGIGPKIYEALSNFGISTIKDILFAFPLRYEQLNANIMGANGRGVLVGEYEAHNIVYTKSRKRMFQALFKGRGGYFSGIWLYFNNKYPASILVRDKQYNIYGSVTKYNGMPVIFHPDILDDDEVGTVRQIYSVPGKLSQKIYHKALDQALHDSLTYIGETLPEDIRFKYRYPELQDTIYTLHKPETAANVESIADRSHPALCRLIYEELFYLQLRIFLKKSQYASEKGVVFDTSRSLLDEIVPLMPFKLTIEQNGALKDIFKDMKSEGQMNRLLQGDVGSGKTIVAFVASLVAVKNGYQAVILAPTEVLAEQHYNNLNIFLKGSGYNASLLTGSVKPKDKVLIKSAIKDGDIHIIVGTHAVIQEDVEFKKLGFAVIDEQHRFGVKQRKALMDKGATPDILLMTATPIPRTLALTYYGDLELSEIASLPPGRIPPITKAYKESMLKSAFIYVAEKLHQGDKAFFIYPAIEDSEKSNLKSVNKNVSVVKRAFPTKSVGLLHGKMKGDEKSQILNEFKSGSLDILVSTTVVEVGVDVKDATVILIENADRFGLAQLHQLRGRVGRNDKQSYCILIASDEISEEGYKRLRAMEEHTSGFKLAELDLELRGQGDFFGVKQSGIPEFQYADIVKDQAILRSARRDAQAIILEDPQLLDQKNSLIRSVLMYRWKDEYELFLVG